MIVKVLKRFRDKNTLVLHKKNTEIEVTEKRVEEINSTSFGVLVEAMKEPETKPDKKVGDKNAGKSVKRH